MPPAGPSADRPAGAAEGIGAFIRRQRQLAHLSLRELSAASSVSNAYLSQIERGLHQPSVRVLRAVADALELSSEQLMAQVGITATSQPPVAESGSGRPTATERALAEDPWLDDEARASLLVLYRRMAQLSPPHA